MEHVFIFTCIHKTNKSFKDYFMIYGVYTNLEDAKDDMEKHVKYISERDDIKSIEKGIGLETVAGSTSRYDVYFKDGSWTEYKIQDRILDQKCYK